MNKKDYIGIAIICAIFLLPLTAVVLGILKIIHNRKIKHQAKIDLQQQQHNPNWQQEAEIEEIETIDFEENEEILQDDAIVIPINTKK